MRISFLKTVRVARAYGVEEFHPCYVYDLPDNEAAIFLRKGLAYEPSRADLVFDSLLRLSWPSTRVWRTALEIAKAVRAMYGVDIAAKEVEDILSDPSGWPVVSHDGLYSFSEAVH